MLSPGDKRLRQPCELRGEGWSTASAFAIGLHQEVWFRLLNEPDFVGRAAEAAGAPRATVMLGAGHPVERRRGWERTTEVKSYDLTMPEDPARQQFVEPSKSEVVADECIQL